MSSAPLVMGQGLAFHNVEIKRDHGDMTLIGEIVNTMNEKRGVPTLQITQLLEDDLLGNTSLIKPEKEILEAGETLQITLKVQHVGKEVQNLKIGFEGHIAENSGHHSDEKLYDESKAEVVHH
jgi:hypothetical protein